MTQPHPFRCETCIGPCPVLTGSFFEDRLRNSPELANITSLVGCASHSSRPTPEPEQFYLSFDALMGIHREITNIKRVSDHISDLLTPMRLSMKEHDAAIAAQTREDMLDEMFPRNTKINSNGDLEGGWELDPKALFKLQKEIETNPQYEEEPIAEQIEVVVLAIMKSLRSTPSTQEREQR